MAMSLKGDSSCCCYCHHQVTALDWTAMNASIPLAAVTSIRCCIDYTFSDYSYKFTECECDLAFERPISLRRKLKFERGIVL